MVDERTSPRAMELDRCRPNLSDIRSVRRLRFPPSSSATAGSPGTLQRPEPQPKVWARLGTPVSGQVPRAKSQCCARSLAEGEVFSTMSVPWLRTEGDNPEVLPSPQTISDRHSYQGLNTMSLYGMRMVIGYHPGVPSSSSCRNCLLFRQA